jgi:hypothetical protein
VCWPIEANLVAELSLFWSAPQFSPEKIHYILHNFYSIGLPQASPEKIDYLLDVSQQYLFAWVWVQENLALLITARSSALLIAH